MISSFNRDMVECKEYDVEDYEEMLHRFNRNMVECKTRLLDTIYFAKFGLIAP